MLTSQSFCQILNPCKECQAKLGTDGTISPSKLRALAATSLGHGPTGVPMLRCSNTTLRRLIQRMLAAFFALAPALSIAETPTTSKPTTSPSTDATPTARRIVVLHSGQTSTNATFDAMRNALARKDYICIPIELPAGATADDPERAHAIATLKDIRAAAILAIGPVAAQIATDSSKLPIVATMIPDALDTPFAATDKQRTTLTLDVAPDTLIAQMRRLQHSMQHIAILTSSRSEKTAHAIQKAAEKKKLTVTLISANRTSFSAALTRLTESSCDAVLMLPDGQIYNSVNVRELLLWGLRQKRAVWAFSENLVKAGAFAAIATSPDAVASHAVDLVAQRLAKPNQSIALTYANAVDISFNDRTAQLIGIVPNDDALRVVTRRHGKKQ